MFTSTGIKKSLALPQKHIILLVMSFVVFLPVLQAQMNVAIDEVKSCEQEEVLIPVNVTDFTDVAAITLFIHFDTTKAVYLELENIHSGLSGGSLVRNFSSSPQPTLGISWASLSSCTIASGKLFDIRMHYSGGNCTLSFSENCELMAGDLSIITGADYVSGSIDPLLDIVVQPIDLVVYEGEDAMFPVSSIVGTSYQWQENSDGLWVDLNNGIPYSGVQSPELLISEVPLHFNGNLYRCQFANSGCQKTSDQAFLLVDSVYSINPVKQIQKPEFYIHPNPSIDYAHIVFHTFPQGNFDILLFSMDGQEKLHISDPSLSGMANGIIPIDCSNLSPGVYFVQITGEELLGTQVFIKQ